MPNRRARQTIGESGPFISVAGKASKGEAILLEWPVNVAIRQFGPGLSKRRPWAPEQAPCANRDGWVDPKNARRPFEGVIEHGRTAFDDPIVIFNNVLHGDLDLVCGPLSPSVEKADSVVGDQL